MKSGLPRPGFDARMRGIGRGGGTRPSYIRKAFIGVFRPPGMKFACTFNDEPVRSKDAHHRRNDDHATSSSDPIMAELSPPQRTASTGRILLTAGALVASEAMWQGSVTRTLIASGLLAAGGALLAFAKRAAD
jgi:hypothetical protein